MRPNVRETRQMRPSNAVRTVWDAEAIDTSHLGFRPIQKIVTIHASSGFIRGIPIKFHLASNYYRYRCRFFGWFAPIYRAIWSTGWSTCSQNPTARTTSHRAPACPAKTALTWLGAWRRCASALPPCARSRLRSAPLLRGAGPGALSAVLLYPYPKNRCV